MQSYPNRTPPAWSAASSDCTPAPFPDSDVPSALHHPETLQGEQRSGGGSGIRYQILLCWKQRSFRTPQSVYSLWPAFRSRVSREASKHRQAVPGGVCVSPVESRGQRWSRGAHLEGQASSLPARSLGHGGTPGHNLSRRSGSKCHPDPNRLKNKAPKISPQAMYVYELQAFFPFSKCNFCC